LYLVVFYVVHGLLHGPERGKGLKV
jgi:hypothetical protein